MAVFRTTLVAGSGNNVGIEVPEDVVLSFGVGKRVPVVVTIDGGYSYRNTIAVMGGRYFISFNAETRAATGRGAGDDVEVTLEHDTAPRTVEVPDILQTELDADPVAAAGWEKVAPSQKRAHVSSLLDAKSDETRDRRLAKILEKLRG